MSAEHMSRRSANPLLNQETDRLDIRIGENANIELLGSGERMWGEVVGMKTGRFIALWVPALKVEKTRRTFLGEGMVAVRCLAGGRDLVGFKTTASQLLQDPYPLLFLDYPDKIERVNLRKAKRVEARIESTIFREAAEISGTIVDISAGGAKVAVRDMRALAQGELGVDSECVVLFKLAEDSEEHCITSMVRNVTKTERDALIGFKFVSYPGDALVEIERFVAQAEP